MAAVLNFKFQVLSFTIHESRFTLHASHFYASTVLRVKPVPSEVEGSDEGGLDPLLEWPIPKRLNVFEETAAKLDLQEALLQGLQDRTLGDGRRLGALPNRLGQADLFHGLGEHSAKQFRPLLHHLNEGLFQQASQRLIIYNDCAHINSLPAERSTAAA